MELTFWRQSENNFNLKMQFDIVGIREYNRIRKEHSRYITGEGFNCRRPNQFVLMISKPFKNQKEIQQYVDTFAGAIYAIKDFGDGKTVQIK